MAKNANLSPFIQDETATYVHHMLAVLFSLDPVQAARPTCHWWRRPRGLAWFRVLRIWSLVTRPASAGSLSRVGDDLVVARGPRRCLRPVRSEEHTSELQS